MNFQTLLSLFIISITFFITAVEALTPSDIPILACPSNRIDKRKGELAVCAIFKDEGKYLKEWIEYHRLVGVSHFYLYNNMSFDTYWLVLYPYVQQGIVELFDVPFDSTQYFDGAATHNFVQVCCYNHAIKLAKNKSTWLAIIDSDEFICPVIDGTITKALQRYDYAGSLTVYWQIYGTSHVWDINPGELMIEKLLLRESNSPNGLFKSIIRPKYATCEDPHWSKISGVLPMVLPNHQHFTHTPLFSSLPVDIIRINHYSFRTDLFYETVKKPRKIQWGFNPTPEAERAMLDYYNSVYDPVMLQFVPQLKKRMFGN